MFSGQRLNEVRSRNADADAGFACLRVNQPTVNRRVFIGLEKDVLLILFYRCH